MTMTPTCTVISSGAAGTASGAQGLTYAEGISAQSAGARGLCMHMVRIPPGARARAHLHANHETAIHVLQGRAEMWFGEQLEHHCVTDPGDWLYIPAGMPHLPFNPGDTEVVGIVARTDANQHESVTLLPELDAIHA